MSNNEIVENEYMWNPWHGCHKCSEGCFHCYMYERDKNYGINSNIVKMTKSGFRLPIQKIRNKDANTKQEKYELHYKIPSGSTIMTCLTSDFFIEEADVWRHDAWEFIHERGDCLFEIITKRPQRIEQTLPDNWLDGWSNVLINVTAENEERAWERIPILLDLPIKHKGIVIEPMLEKMDIRPFLSSGDIEIVTVGGESYNGFEGVARELRMEWVKDIKEQCKYYDTPFYFHQTGTRLVLDNGKTIHINKRDEKNLAKFYNLDQKDAGGINWETITAELELHHRAEQAHNIYKQLTLSDLGIL